MKVQRPSSEPEILFSQGLTGGASVYLSCDKRNQMDTCLCAKWWLVNPILNLGLALTLTLTLLWLMEPRV